MTTTLEVDEYCQECYESNLKHLALVSFLAPFRSRSVRDSIQEEHTKEHAARALSSPNLFTKKRREQHLKPTKKEVKVLRKGLLIWKDGCDSASSSRQIWREGLFQCNGCCDSWFHHIEHNSSPDRGTRGVLSKCGVVTEN